MKNLSCSNACRARAGLAAAGVLVGGAFFLIDSIPLRAVILALGGILSWAWIPFLGRQRDQLLACLRAAGAGHTATRMDPALGPVAAAFNRFLDHVHQTFRLFEDSSIQLAASSEQLASSSQNIAGNADKQQRVVADISLIVNHMTKQSEEGNRMVQEIVQQIFQASTSMTSAVETMKEIETNSAQISDAVTVITDIAEQTNLLALNAAIEAARAGEQGKGFAVVADEVRKLAERSAISADEIMGSVARSTAIVNKEVATVTQTGTHLTKLVDDIQMVSVKLQEVSRSIAEELGTVEQLNAISKANYLNSQEIGAASEQLATQAQHMVSSIKHV